MSTLDEKMEPIRQAQRELIRVCKQKLVESVREAVWCLRNSAGKEKCNEKFREIGVVAYCLYPRLELTRRVEVLFELWALGKIQVQISGVTVSAEEYEGADIGNGDFILNAFGYRYRCDFRVQDRGKCGFAILCEQDSFCACNMERYLIAGKSLARVCIENGFDPRELLFDL